MPNIFPSHIQKDVSGYITNFIIPNMKNISNLTIVFAMIFAVNGTHSLINGFNLNTNLQRGVVKEYLVAFVITIAFIVLIIASLLGVYYSEVVLKLFTPEMNISWLVNNMSRIIGFFSFPVFYFILLALFYWVGCLKITTFKQAIPGAIPVSYTHLDVYKRQPIAKIIFFMIIVFEVNESKVTKNFNNFLIKLSVSWLSILR